jgi:phosphate transport system protein
MSKHLERDLESLEQEILALSAYVEQMIDNACRALCEARSDLAREVIEADAYVDNREVHIEEECLKILALHQPVAIDLRRTAAILKINNDVERIADLAVNIAQRAERLELKQDYEIPANLERMVQLSVQMVRDALDAFVQLDPTDARAVCQRDDAVDAYNLEVTNDLYRQMKANAALIEPCLCCFAAARDIERIADHATNIAEDVIYLVEGDIARHRHRESKLADPS